MHYYIKYNSAKINKVFDNRKEMKKNKEKMTLRGYYDELPDAVYPKTNFINEVVRKTGVSAATVRNWIFYGMKPANENHIKVLSELTGITSEKLWAD